MFASRSNEQKAAKLPAYMEELQTGLRAGYLDTDMLMSR